MIDRVSTLIKGPGAAAAPAIPRPIDEGLVRKLKGLRDERARLLGVLETEKLRTEELVEKLRMADAKRVDELTEARVSGDSSHQARADELSAEAATLRREIDDSTAVAARIETLLTGLHAGVEALRNGYRAALSAFLDALYAQAMARYNQLAPELAEAVVEVAAIRRVMMDRRLGNTNGWNGRVLLPGMRAQQGTTVRPILDGESGDYDAAAEHRTAAVEELIRAAGFTYGLESER